MRNFDEIHAVALGVTLVFVLLMAMVITSHLSTMACIKNGGDALHRTCRFAGN